MATCYGPFTSESNQVSTQIVELEITKQACGYVLSSHNICYEVIATNPSDINMVDVLFSDELDPNVTYIPGTFTVDGYPQTPMMANNTIQYPIDLPSGESVEIRFCVKINNTRNNS